MQNDFIWRQLLTLGQRAWKTSICLYRECNLSSLPQFWLIFLTHHEITPCNIRRFINECLLSLWYSVTAVWALVFQGHSSLCNLPPFSLTFALWLPCIRITVVTLGPPGSSPHLKSLTESYPQSQMSFGQIK